VNGDSNVHSGGSLTVPPASKPYIVYRLQATTPNLKDASVAVRQTTIAEVWAYDDPGAYDRIDSILADVRARLVGPVAEVGKVCCEWSGDSGELSDDEMKAITRNSTFLLIGGGE
jgi:hypothetical protein